MPSRNTLNRKMCEAMNSGLQHIPVFCVCIPMTNIELLGSKIIPDT
jgi:hypothetical protein